jgi:UDP-N-acetylmuramyl tripeptide synthase
MTQLNRKCPLIGVTGTNGKTSTILMLSFILEQLGYHPAVMETWQGKTAFERFIQSNQSSNYDCLLVEVPVEALRQRQLSGNLFDCGALTNLSVDHLTSCGTPQQYNRLKARFFSELPPQAKTVIPADDPVVLSMVTDVHSDFISYTIDDPHAMITANNIRHENNMIVFDFIVAAELSTFTGQVITPATAIIKLPMAGRHNVANALTAATLALLLTGDLQGVANSFQQFPGIRRNLEMITFDHVRIVDDSAHNPAAIRTALSAVEARYEGKIHILHGIYGGGGQTINRCNARELATFMHRNTGSQLFVTRSMYHSKNKHQVRLGEEKAFLEELKEHHIDFYYFPDLPDACESILSHTSRNDLILMLGGPTLNRAREIMLRATGEKRASHALVPSELIAVIKCRHGQAVMINPT